MGKKGIYFVVLRNGTVTKSTHCSCTGLQFSSHYRHQVSHSCLKLHLQGSLISLAFSGICALVNSPTIKSKINFEQWIYFGNSGFYKVNFVVTKLIINLLLINIDLLILLIIKDYLLLIFTILVLFISILCQYITWLHDKQRTKHRILCRKCLKQYRKHYGRERSNQQLQVINSKHRY